MVEYIPLPGFERPDNLELARGVAPPDWVVTPGSFEDAKAALDLLVESIGAEPWLKSVVIAGDAGAYRLVVTVTTDGARDIIASEIGGIPIEVVTEASREVLAVTGAVIGATAKTEILGLAPWQAGAAAVIGAGAALLALGGRK